MTGAIPPFKCSGCGKLIALAPEDSGQRIVCSACGTCLKAPVFARQGEAAVPALPAVSDDPPLVGSPASEPRPPNRWTIPLVMSLFWAGLLIGLVWYMARPVPDAWELSNGPHLLALKLEADGLAREHHFAQAHAKYAEIQQLVGLREIRDPRLKSELDAARHAQEQIFSQLLDHVAPVPPAVVDAIPPVGSLQLPRTAPSTRPATTGPAPLHMAASQPTSRPIVSVPAPPAGDPPAAPSTRPAEPKLPPPILRAQRPPSRRFAIASPGISDEEIGQAIEGLVNEILGHFDGPALKDNADNPYGPGLEVLCVYSLLQAGQAVPDQRLNVRAKSMKAMLDHIRDLDLRGRYETYARGLRATALAVYNRPEDRQVLKEDLAWLVSAHHQGGYSYGVTRGGWDNSNSQYGLLGAWSAAEVGGEVPLTYWMQVQNHWQECQYDDGEFGYGAAGARGGRLSMTVAGIASLFVTHDYIDAPKYGNQVGRDPFGPHVARGLKYLEAGDNCIAGHTGGYSLYGLERVGLASGFKYFGAHDWYRELAQRIISGGMGGWGMRGFGRLRFGHGDLVEDSYTLLFLARGRHPILMNKLRFDGSWANRPRDVANLARFASRELERPINWQVVPIDRDWRDWDDSPILYLASHQPIPLKEPDYIKLRRFVEAGGMIFSQADGSSQRFNSFVPDLARKVFPEFEFRDLPADSELYSVNFQVDPKPRLRYLTNGSRILWIHSPDDIAMHWQLRAEKTRRNIFELGLNLFVYAGGKSDLRNRLVSNYIPRSTDATSFVIRMARIRYGGLWDPEPMAFERFSRWFTYQTGYDLVVSPTPAGKLDPQTFPIAHLTGTVAWTASDDDVNAIRRYVEGGGVLLIDACGGSAAFGHSMVYDLLHRAFPESRLDGLPPAHPLLVGGADGIDAMKLAPRQFVDQKLGRGAVHMEILSCGRGKVIYSPIDLTTGLLGTNTWGVLGYRPESCLTFVKNVILWAADGAPEAR